MVTSNLAAIQFDLIDSISFNIKVSIEIYYLTVNETGVKNEKRTVIVSCYSKMIAHVIHLVIINTFCFEVQ